MATAGVSRVALQAGYATMKVPRRRSSALVTRPWLRARSGGLGGRFMVWDRDYVIPTCMGWPAGQPGGGHQTAPTSGQLAPRDWLLHVSAFALCALCAVPALTQFHSLQIKPPLPAHSSRLRVTGNCFSLAHPTLAPLPFFSFSLSSTTRVRVDARAIMQSRRTAIQALKGTRCFSTSHTRLAASPYRRAAPAVNTAKVVKEDAKRPQSTAAAPETDARARPSPAFNRQDFDVQPLRQRQPEMDHSFVGMKGGEIFHEMMLRQGVKHICTSPRTCPPNWYALWRLRC